MKGQVCSEVEVDVAANKAWELYGTLELAKFIEQKLPLIHKIEVVQGDGGVGTILNLVFVPGTPGLSSYKEKYTKVDDEKHIKEAEVIKGGYLDYGFTMYKIRVEIIDKAHNNNECVIKSTIEYEVKDEVASSVTDLVTIKPLEDIAKLAKTHLEAV
ncbi:hypothetical protein RND81_09G079300 [Saponaria officinalis]|uniref:Bet v I/Major latex protein domain-containing protein n=1 Tax=Saponaria officinalis TaxID=3572 RepID=A0AAW1IIF1_SAPOF